MFVALPQVFEQMPAGEFVAPVFYLLVMFAALTSAVSLLETVVSVFIDGAKVNSMAFVQEKVNGYRPGDKAVLRVYRNGSERDFEVTFLGTTEETGTVSDDGSIAFYGSKLRKAPQETLDRLGLKNGVEIVSVGDGKLLDAGASEGFVILYVNDQPVSKPEEVIEIAKKSRRAIYIEGVTSSGRASYFGFGKE